MQKWIDSRIEYYRTVGPALNLREIQVIVSHETVNKHCKSIIIPDLLINAAGMMPGLGTVILEFVGFGVNWAYISREQEKLKQNIYYIFNSQAAVTGNDVEFDSEKAAMYLNNKFMLKQASVMLT